MLKFSSEVEEAPQLIRVLDRDGDPPPVLRRKNVKTRAFVQNKTRRNILPNQTSGHRSPPGIWSLEGRPVLVQLNLIRKQFIQSHGQKIKKPSQRFQKQRKAALNCKRQGKRKRKESTI